MSMYLNLSWIKGHSSPFVPQENTILDNNLKGWGIHICSAGQDGTSAGGGKGESTKEADNTRKEENASMSGNKVGEQAPSITDPDTSLTGDTGNSDIGQTDLGAGPVGAGNETNIGSDASTSASENTNQSDDNEETKQE